MPAHPRASHDTLVPRIIFFIMLVLILLPILFFPWYSKQYHQIYHSPSIQSGVLDLKGYEFSNGPPIPLDGQWEFYWNQWIVTDQQTDAVPSAMLHVPSTWNQNLAEGSELPHQGYASYRIILKNCPPNANLISYVPNLGAAYRVFLNGSLVAVSGTPDTNLDAKNVSLSLIRERFEHPLPADSQLVIEIASCHVGGLYLTPILANNTKDFYASNLRHMIAAMYIGMLVLALGFCIFSVFINGVTPQSVFLLFMDMVIFFRILVKDEFFGILKLFFPIFQFHFVNTAMQVFSLFLPAAFILWIKDYLDIPIHTKIVRYIVVFELICSIPILYLSLTGELLLGSILYVLSLLPFAFLFYWLYQNIKNGIPYTLTVAIATMLIVSCIVVANQYSSGLMVMNISLFPATCFVLATLLHVSIIVRKSNEHRLQALENTTLRLQIRESETALMLSQIKPHFLYNALIAIQVLCSQEPETAGEAIGNFSSYLRANMQSINSSIPIPFSQELQHVKNYAAIEKLRFKERLHVVYDIGTEDFYLPPLTIQPLVENAIKHGVCKKIIGGTVTLRTYEDERYIYVEVLDDGDGFQVSSMKQQLDSYGIKNITFRLREQIHAAIVIQSQINQGTRVQITIPKGGMEYDCHHSR